MFDTINTFATRAVNAVATSAMENPTTAAITGCAVGATAAYGAYTVSAPLVPMVTNGFRALRDTARAKLHAWSTEPTPDAPAAPAAAA